MHYFRIVYFLQKQDFFSDNRDYVSLPLVARAIIYIYIYIYNYIYMSVIYYCVNESNIIVGLFLCFF